MSSFSEATALKIKEQKQDGTRVYEGLADKDWCIGAYVRSLNLICMQPDSPVVASVPHGGECERYF